MASLHFIWALMIMLASFSTSFVESSRKELRPKDVNQEATQPGNSIQFTRVDPSRVIQLSWRPRVFLYRGFLSYEECDRLISLAHRKNKHVLVNGGVSEKVAKNRMLTSSELPIDTNDDITARIEERVSAWTFLPKENSNSLRILHYGHEEGPGSHNYFGNKSVTELHETLMATVVLYLSNATRGGEILFPESELENSGLKIKTCSDFPKSDHALKPIKGNAILFFSRQPGASHDKTSSHSRCPVLEGEMWSATKFFHIRPTKTETETDGCIDEDENCSMWANHGECQKNPVYMIGTPDYYGTCRKSCKVC